MAQNKAAYVLEKGTPFRVRDTEMPTPGADEIVVRNGAIAINPIDSMQQKTGVYVQAFPRVLGHDLTGEVYQVGSAVTKFKPGDRVVAHAWQMITGKVEDAAFAHFTKVPASNAALIPENMAFTDAAVLPLAIDTAVSGLFGTGPFGLPWPTLSPKPSGDVLIVYGGSSSVGITTIQLAIASGARVIAIASSKQHDLCKAAGASDVFDYKDSDLVADAVKAIGNDKFLGIYDAICQESTYKHDAEILKTMGGGALATTHPPPEVLPPNVTAQGVFGTGEHVFPLWEGYVAKALERGQLKPLPRPYVAGEGLESIMAGVDKLAAGVSGQKIVVEL